MLGCRYRGTLVWAVSAMLLAGCATAQRQKAPAVASAQTAAPKVEPPGPDEADARLIEAHAHYALGLIDELDEKPDQALDEYTRAATDDPANEGPGAGGGPPLSATEGTRTRH